MIECDAKQVPDAIVNEAIVLAQAKIDEMCDIQTQYLSQLTVTPRAAVFNKPSDVLVNAVRDLFTDEIKNGMIGNTKVSFNEKFNEFQHMVLDQMKDLMSSDSETYSYSKIKMAVFQVAKDVVRDRTLQE